MVAGQDLKPLIDCIKNGKSPNELHLTFVALYGPVVSGVSRAMYDPASTIGDIYKWLTQALERYPTKPQSVWMVLYFFAEYVTHEGPNLLDLAKTLQVDSLLIYPLLAKLITVIRNGPPGDFFGVFGCADDPTTSQPMYPDILSRGMENIVKVVECLGRGIRHKAMATRTLLNNTREIKEQGIAGMAMCAEAHLVVDDTGFINEWATHPVLRLGAPNRPGFAIVDDHASFSRYVRLTLAFAPWSPGGQSVLSEFERFSMGDEHADPAFEIRCSGITDLWMRALTFIREYMWLFVHQIRTAPLTPDLVEQKISIVGSIIELLGVLAPQALPYSDIGFTRWANQHPPGTQVSYAETSQLFLGGALAYLQQNRLAETVPPRFLLLCISLDVIIKVQHQGHTVSSAGFMEPFIGRLTPIDLEQQCTRYNYTPVFQRDDYETLLLLANTTGYAVAKALFGDHPLSVFWHTVMQSVSPHSHR